MLDVDGVLVTGRPWAGDIERDLGIAPERLQALLFRPHWAEIVIGRKDLRAVLEVCLPELAPGLSAEDFLSYWFARDSNLNQALLAECDALRRRGLRIFLATNQEHLRAADLMERLGLGQRVEGMVYSARVAAKKPERAFFDAALAISGSHAEETLLVDDSAANVAAARAAGWQAHHWTGPASLSALLEDLPG